MRRFAGIASVLLLSGLLGWVLSLATTRVRNWFVMTDELYYERLAISVAQTESLLPRLHGDVVANVNQLYPVLLSTVYGNGDVGASLEAAHRLNAFLIVSAAVPVYLLARYAGAGLAASVWAGVLAAAVPWVVLASFLLTEVVAYPAFCWAFLAVVHAVARRTAWADALALAAIAAAALARVQLLVLFAVLVVAAVAVERRDVVRRRVLAGALGLAAAGVGLLALLGEGSSVLGSYAVTATTLRVDFGLAVLVLEHLSALALGLAFVPFLLGVAWLIDGVRDTGEPRERAFALAGLAALALVTVEVASFDQRFGAELVKDRYLFYVVPVVLVALALVVSRRRWPPWWALLGAAVPAAAGFLTLPLATYVKLNADSPLAMLNDGVLRLATGESWARAMLVLATAVGLLLLLVGGAFLPRRPLAAGVAALATVALPLETVYAFERLFRVDGTNGLPLTLDQSGVFGWVDRHLGGPGRATFAQYPVNPPDWWAGQGYWWELEFWNESVTERWREGGNDWLADFDPATGAYRGERGTSHVVVYGRDVRFRLAGRQLAYERDAYLFETAQPWRAAWLTREIHPDGWTLPHVPAEIVVFPEPGQRRPLQRFLTISLGTPGRDRDRPFTVRSNLQQERGAIAPETSADLLVSVCVPPRAPSRVLVSTPHVSPVYRDPTKAALTGEEDRPAGLLLRSIALAGERVPLERCPPEPEVG